MQRHTDLEKLLYHIWEEIERGVRDAEHPYRAPVFATVGADTPRVRSVILRRADRKTRSLLFHTDRRSQKIGEIQYNSQVVWHFWSPQSGEQLRLRGEAFLHFDDALADEVWQASHPKSLKLYMKPTPPGTKVERPNSGLVDAVESVRLESHEQVAQGRQYFTVVRTQINAIDFLHLHPEGNYRASFQWDGTEEHRSWIIP